MITSVEKIRCVSLRRNITAKSDVGSYTYAGDQGGSYANPHAATTINGQTYAYDNNGNLTSGGGLTNTWDYKNELTQTTSGSGTVTYGYGTLHHQRSAQLSDALKRV